MKKKPRKKSKTKLAAIASRKKLAEWSRLVRERDNYTCLICGSTNRPQAHHVLEKYYYKKTMYDPRVGITVCAKCHKFNKYSCHTNPLWFVKWLKEHRPEQYDFCIGEL